jgi:2-dehydro-3-deoxyphosphogalactonate aldolase
MSAWREAFGALPLIAILRGIETAEISGVGEALAEAGFSLMEATLDSPGALETIAAARERFEGRLLVGAGTVLTPAQARDAAAAGAGFIVSPDCNPAVIETARALGLAALPGVFTPTEAFRALDAGADALKLFPAEVAGPAALKALRPILPKGALVLPVGGVGPASLAAWREAGADGFGIGGALYRRGLSQESVGANARAFVAAWRALP